MKREGCKVDRRNVLLGAFGGVLGAWSLGGWARAAEASGASPPGNAAGLNPRPAHADVAFSAVTPQGVTRVSGKMAIVSGGKDNVLAFATGSGGVLLVDSGSPGYTSDLVRQLTRFVGAPPSVHTLINTHWHPDQTGSNASFGKAGAKIVSQHKTLDWISTEHYVPPPADHYVAALPKAAWPTQTFFTDEALTVGGEHIECGHLVAAHTEGDCYVYFRDSNVLAVGHVAAPAQDPELDWFAGGWIGGRVDALAKLYELADENTKVVPAFGSVVARAALRDEHDALQVVYTRMADLVRKGYSAADMLNAGVLRGVSRKWSDPEKFVNDAFKGLWAYQDTLAPNIL